MLLKNAHIFLCWPWNSVGLSRLPFLFWQPLWPWVFFPSYLVKLSGLSYFDRLWVVPCTFQFWMMDLTVLLGIIKALEIFLYISLIWHEPFHNLVMELFCEVLAPASVWICTVKLKGISKVLFLFKHHVNYFDSTLLLKKKKQLFDLQGTFFIPEISCLRNVTVKKWYTNQTKIL